MHLFDGVHYHISSSISSLRSSQLTHVLDSNGATLAQSIDDLALTHVITNSNRFEGWQDVASREEAGELAVVTDKWVDRSMLLGKLQSTAHYSADSAMIFSGVVACAAELPAADLEVLSAGIVALGGQWRTGLTKDVTHLFAISTSSPKYTTALHFQEHTNVKVLLPHWFDDAVRLGMGSLDTSSYEWPDPILLRGPGDVEKDQNDSGKKVPSHKVDVEKKTLYKTASLWTPNDPLPTTVAVPLSSSNSSEPSLVGKMSVKNVWQGRRVFLGASLELTGGRREAVEAGIKRAGGVIVEDGETGVEECDVYVTRFRSGKEYVTAVRLAKTIGTLPWVFHVQSTGVLSRPLDQLLWYPIPRRSIEGFASHEITLTNYTGESREYLKKLITAMGATFTPSMSGKNTVLIAAYISGTKTTKAASWSIPIVNHTWLEDCFVKWRNLTVALEKYIVFPPGVDFSTMLGERGVGRAVEEIGEEELEALIEEEAEEANLRNSEGEDTSVTAREPGAIGKELEADKGLGKDKLDRNGMGITAPVGTENSARDAEEVQNFVRRDGDGDVMMNDDNDRPKSTGEDDGMNIDDSILEEKSPKDKKKPVVEVPRPRMSQGKTITSRLQEKENMGSASKTRVRRAKGKDSGKEREKEREASTNDLRVTRRKSGQLEVTPVKKGRRKVPSESEESSDEVEVVQIIRTVEKDKGKGKAKLVKRAGERHDSWITDEAEEPRVPAQRQVSSEEDEDEESPLKSKSKKALRNKGAGNNGTPTAKLKTGKHPKVLIESDEDSVAVSKPRARKVTRRAASSDDGGKDEPEVPVKAKPKAKAKRKATTDSDEDDQEENEDLVHAKHRRPKTSTKGKGKLGVTTTTTDESDAIAIEPSKSKGKAKEPKRPNTKAKFKVVERITESGGNEDEDEDMAPPRKEKKVLTTSTNGRGKPTTGDSAPLSSSNKTPNRTISVLLPQLTLTKKTPSKNLGNDDVEMLTPNSRLARTESIRAAAGERGRVSANRPSTSAVASGSKAKVSTKLKPPAEDAPTSSSPPAIEDIVTSGRSRRSAATKASQRLRDEIMPDMNSYQQEMRNSGRAGRKSIGDTSESVASWRKKRTSEIEDQDEREKKRQKVSARPSTSRKKKTHASDDDKMESIRRAKKETNSVSEDDQDMSDDEDIPQILSTKSLRKAKNNATSDDGDPRTIPEKPVSIKLLTTQVTLPEDVLKTLSKLGVKMTTRATECTHLLAPHLVRTEKFLCALAVAPFILTDKWALESAAANKLLDEQDYLLHDKTNERKYDFVLADAIKRAKKLQGGLFAKKFFYVTPKVPIDIKLLKNVVTAGGGQISTQPPTLRVLGSNPGRHVISCPGDVSIWRPIAREHSIYTHELILTGALKQEIDWESSALKVPGSY